MKRSTLILIVLVLGGGGYAYFGKTPTSPTVSATADAGRYQNCIRMAEYYEKSARESRDRQHIKHCLQRASELRHEATSYAH